MPATLSERCLVLKLGAMGDVLVSTALLRALRQARPHLRLTMLTSSECRALLEGNPDLDDLLTLDVPTSRNSLRGFADLAGWLRRIHLPARNLPPARGLALVLHRDWRLALLCRAAGFRQVIGFAGPHNPWLTQSVPFDLRLHRLERQEALLHALGIAGSARSMRLDLTPAERNWGESAWPASPKVPRLVLAPGGGSNRWSQMPNRRWPAASFRAIAERAQATGFAVHLVGGPADRDLATAIASGLTAVTCTGAGAWSARQSAAVIAAAHLVLSNDSLPLFLAAAVGTPVIGLYGPTDLRLVHPPGSGPALQGEAGCGPCYVPSDGMRGRAYCCPRPRCMELIQPSQVWVRILELLSLRPFAAACADHRQSTGPLPVCPPPPARNTSRSRA